MQITDDKSSSILKVYRVSSYCAGYRAGYRVASYPGSLIIAGEEKRAWFQSLAHALN